MSNSVPEISDAEFEVLDSLWQKNPASANDIITKLNETKPWHEKTVKTLIINGISCRNRHVNLRYC